MNNIKKFFGMFQSPALGTVFRWASCIRRRLACICFLNVLQPLCSLGVTLATKQLVDSAILRQTDSLWRYGLLLGALILTQQVFSYVESWITLRADVTLQRKLQGMFAKRVLGREYASLKGFHSGEMISRFFSDVSVVKDGIIEILPSVVGSAIGFIGASAILISLDWRLILALIAGGLIGMCMLAVFREPIKKRHGKRQESEEKLHVSVQETFENIRLIKAGLLENRSLSKIGLYQAGLEKAQISQRTFSMTMKRGIGLAISLSWLFCMVWGCVSICMGRMTYGSLAAIIQLMSSIESPFIEAFGLAGQAYETVSSAERILQLTDLPEEEQSETLPDFDEICFKNLSFCYDDGNEDVIRDLTFSIRKGDFTAVTGISGGGKTSLFQLLLGIYQPTSGSLTIRYGDRSVPASRGTRKLFAYVPQGNTLFSGTLRENLLLFTDQADEAALEAAIRCACIEDLVREIGLDAVLGERGIGLSEGQAQRVAIARALLCDAPILLLDEATSALDEETEARFLRNLSAMRSKTCLIVTHRPAALAICSHRLHLQDGKLAWEGDRESAPASVRNDGSSAGDS